MHSRETACFCRVRHPGPAPHQASAVLSGQAKPAEAAEASLDGMVLLSDDDDIAEPATAAHAGDPVKVHEGCVPPSQVRQLMQLTSVWKH